MNPHSTYGEGLVRARASFFSSSSALASTFFPSLVSLDWIEDSIRLRQRQKESGYLYPPSGLVEKEIVAVREELEGSWNGSALHALFVCFCSPVSSLNFLVLRSSRYASLTEEELNDMERFLLETRTVREDGEEQVRPDVGPRRLSEVADRWPFAFFRSWSLAASAIDHLSHRAFVVEEATARP